MGDRPEAVLLMTHMLDGRIVGQYRRLTAEAGAGRDVHILYNRDDDPSPGYMPPEDVRVFSFRAGDVRAMGYPRKGRRLNARDVELFALLFMRRHPWYARAWVIEYDVEFTGQWSTLFDAFDDSPADLLGTTLHRYEINPHWENWRTVRPPKEGVPRERWMRAFLPCHRLTRAAAEALDQAYRKGWSGHYEATVPTVLAEAGLLLEDMGGDGEFVRPGNLNRFYTNTPSLNELSPGSFVFRPVRAAPGVEPDRLWHPVKAQCQQKGWATGRRATLSRWASTFARTGVLRLARLRMR